MAPIHPQQAREFAVEVVATLRAAGRQALWAGGCVRDQLLGLAPKDYDVATDAPPDAVRQILGKRRRTLAIGAAFGVITVIGPRGAGQIDVATFRRDAAYSDGRHPDAVTFSTPEEDAQRRDFTINGLFFDPLENRVLDFVGGQEDLRQRLVRAIGDPFARIAEDKLRMLRAVRFAAAFDFSLDPHTLQAIQQQAHELVIVSAERIAAELRRMLVSPQRRRAVELLHVAGLLSVVLPEAITLEPDSVAGSPSAWRRTLATLAALEHPSFPSALAALVREVRPLAEHPAADSQEAFLRSLGQRWRLSKDETEAAAWIATRGADLLAARQLPWPRLQRILAAPHAAELVAHAAALAQALSQGSEDVAWCQAKLQLPREELDPPPLLTGRDLQRAGLSPGPQFRWLLDQLRDAQLEGRVRSLDEALALARELIRQGS